jgi:RNA polymerase sigma factor (sigma-70 family)
MTHRSLIQQLFAEHAGALQAFFRRRLRARRDAADLTQEVYLRLLRARRTEILNPEAYLFTVANNLVKEQSVMRRRDQERVDLTHPGTLEALRMQALMADADPTYGIDLEAQVRGLRAVLPELPPRCQLVLALAFDKNLSHREIAERLKVSKTMVRKLLVQAIAKCRKRMLLEDV